ncbi:hypothetical protein SSCG_03402 [Streptomyces clavuligerus]|nr:hypothetical protein SSCG_03402 [Streptomyces clavuligerus]
MASRAVTDRQGGYGPCGSCVRARGSASRGALRALFAGAITECSP